MKVVAADRESRNMGLAGVRDLLSRAMVGRLGTVGSDGVPYVVPVHFVVEDDRIYVHCAHEGKKIDNIKARAGVCFEADELIGVGIDPERPCSNTTYYRSVIATGDAAIVQDAGRKRHVLTRLVEKYSDGRPFAPFPDEPVERTCVIEIVVSEISGKAHLPEGWR